MQKLNWHKAPIEFLVRAKGIEPSSKAWEAFVLPLYHARDIVSVFYILIRQMSRQKN